MSLRINIFKRENPRGRYQSEGAGRYQSEGASSGGGTTPLPLSICGAGPATPKAAGTTVGRRASAPVGETPLPLATPRSATPSVQRHGERARTGAARPSVVAEAMVARRSERRKTAVPQIADPEEMLVIHGGSSGRRTSERTASRNGQRLPTLTTSPTAAGSARSTARRGTWTVGAQQSGRATPSAAPEVGRRSMRAPTQPPMRSFQLSKACADDDVLPEPEPDKACAVGAKAHFAGDPWADSDNEGDDARSTGERRTRRSADDVDEEFGEYFSSEHIDAAPADLPASVAASLGLPGRANSRSGLDDDMKSYSKSLLRRLEAEQVVEQMRPDSDEENYDSDISRVRSKLRIVERLQKRCLSSEIQAEAWPVPAPSLQPLRLDAGDIGG